MNYASNKCVKMIQQPYPLLDLLVKEKTGNQDKNICSKNLLGMC